MGRTHWYTPCRLKFISEYYSRNMIDYIINSHDELPYLKLMLWSLKTHNKSMWEYFNIKVYANDCHDGTQEWCDANGIPCESVNLPGLYSAWNYGAFQTNNQYIIFSGCDFVLAPGFWEAIFHAHKLYGCYHLTGTCIDNGKARPHDDQPWRSWYVRDCGDNWKEFDYDKFITATKQINTSHAVFFETSYCPFLTTRENYNFLQGFDAINLEYPKTGPDGNGADHDFLKRSRMSGRECCIATDAYFYHFGDKSLLQRDDFTYTLQEITPLDSPITRNSRDVSKIRKLHIGAGSDTKQDYINVDRTANCDITGDVATLYVFPDNFASEIYHHHLIERLDREEGLQAIQNWYRVLAPGGKLIFETPEADETFRMWLGMDYHQRWEQVENLNLGFQQQLWNNHKILYDCERMRRMLKEAGFVNIQVANIDHPWLKANMHVEATKL